MAYELRMEKSSVSPRKTELQKKFLVEEHPLKRPSIATGKKSIWWRLIKELRE